MDSYFAKIPSDQRFNKVAWTKFVPSSGLDTTSESIVFNLSRQDSPNVYNLSNVLIEATVTIVKADKKSLPDKVCRVGPVNNALHSLFESVKTTINDELVA